MSATVFNPRHPGWEDLKPIPQDDGPNPVVAIRYSDEYRELMDLFRAVLAANELSKRALALTADVVEANPANYTAWQYRRRCLKSLGSDLREELRFTEATAYDNPKNYQIWFHRRAVVELLGDPTAELPFISNVLLEDSKNYHAWSYRQWVLSTYGDSHNLWGGELKSCHNLLQIDHYNNSAWNMRWFVVSRTATESGTGIAAATSSVADSPPQPPPAKPSPPSAARSAAPVELWPKDIVEREIAYAFDWIVKAPANESPWAYLRGLMRVKASASGGSGWRFSLYPSVKQRILALRDGTKSETGDSSASAGARPETSSADSCIPLLGLLLEVFQDEGAFGEAQAVCAKLAEVDDVREPYWTFRMKQLESSQSAAPAASKDTS